MTVVPGDRGAAVALSLCAILWSGETAGQSAPAPSPPRESTWPGLHATRASRPPDIDGHLTEESWVTASPVTTFTQRDPDEGNPATERTDVRFLYDDEALYVGARLYDDDAERIARRLSPRDSAPDSDRFSVYLDPMHDRLTGAVFRVSAANVQQDSILYNDTFTDESWDAVWQSAVSIDAEGWSVEMRIPLSQLRFTGADEQTWGVNLERYIRRKNEYDWLRLVPKSESGTASRMLDLAGLDGLKPARHLEILPYTAARAEYIAPGRAGNPFNDGSRVFGSAGLDMKVGLTRTLTATATVNPDFGQVEVDPAVVNLSAFETFFQEKRPFFLEGSQIFGNYGRGGANDFWGFNNSEPSIFYSRRIGRAPQLSASGDYVDAPTASTILGAVKLTGKTSSGWSLGFIAGVTSEEQARTSAGSVLGRSTVEPFSNYAVVRVQRDIGRRAGLGFLSTAVNRQLNTPALSNTLTGSAFVGGPDAYVFLDRKRDWVLVGNIAASRVNGSTSAIERLQRAPQRYFQRPDEPHVHLDSTRTSLSGYTGRASLNRNSGLWRVNASIWTGSPGFESNDLGFHGTGDRTGMHVVAQVRDVKSRRFSRGWNAWVAKYYTWNFAREVQSNGLTTNANWNLRNYWNINGGFTANWRALDDRLTRGGPSATSPGGGSWVANVNSDSRRRVSFGVNANTRWTHAGGWNRSGSVLLSMKPSDRVSVSLGPALSRSHVIAQYVRSVTDTSATSTYGSRYVFGTLDQTQLSMTTRVALILTPTMSVQVFAQPLVAGGDYRDFKELALPRTYTFLEYGRAAGSSLSYDSATRSYTADPNGTDTAAVFTFTNPDFSVRSLRMNAVFRWEMRPGSTFYAVWTRQQQDSSNPGPFDAGRDLRAMLAAPGDDVILFKIAYWFGR